MRNRTEWWHMETHSETEEIIGSHFSSNFKILANHVRLKISKGEQITTHRSSIVFFMLLRKPKVPHVEVYRQYTSFIKEIIQPL